MSTSHETRATERVGRFIASRRKSLGLTQRELGERLALAMGRATPIHPNTIGGIENGSRPLQLVEMKPLSTVLVLGVSDLVDVASAAPDTRPQSDFLERVQEVGDRLRDEACRYSSAGDALIDASRKVQNPPARSGDTVRISGLDEGHLFDLLCALAGSPGTLARGVPPSQVPGEDDIRDYAALSTTGNRLIHDIVLSTLWEPSKEDVDNNKLHAELVVAYFSGGFTTCDGASSESRMHRLRMWCALPAARREVIETSEIG